MKATVNTMGSGALKEGLAAFPANPPGSWKNVVQVGGGMLTSQTGKPGNRLSFAFGDLIARLISDESRSEPRSAN